MCSGKHYLEKYVHATKLLCGHKVRWFLHKVAALCVLSGECPVAVGYYSPFPLFSSFTEGGSSVGPSTEAVTRAPPSLRTCASFSPVGWHSTTVGSEVFSALVITVITFISESIPFQQLPYNRLR